MISGQDSPWNGPLLDTIPLSLYGGPRSERVTLPAPKYLTKAAIWVIILLTLSMASQTQYANAAPTSQTSTIKSALHWLSSSENPDGSFESYGQIPTPGAAFALWLNDSHSALAARSFSWLASQLDNSSSYAWGEADIPGAMLHSLSSSSNVPLIRNQSDFSNLLTYQQSGGGFTGYAPGPSYVPVASSVDTDMALWGLVDTGHITSQQRTTAANFLFSLQNSDGSFNLTSAVSSDPLNAFGPELISVTALTILALKDASYTSTNNYVSKALDFLTKTVSTNFTTTGDHKGHVYGAALSALAFQAYGRSVQALASVAFIMTQQNSDGSFLDAARGSSQKTLDTGWVTVALEQVQPGPLFGTFLPRILLVGVIVVIGVVTVVGVLVAYLVLSRRHGKQTMTSGVATTISTY
jgi:prenyltransferase beta subunit